MRSNNHETNWSELGEWKNIQNKVINEIENYGTEKSIFFFKLVQFILQLHMS